MDVEPTESRSPPATTYGSPSYSPPELEERTDHKRKLKDSDKTSEENDSETRERRRKAKGKAKESLSREDKTAEEDDRGTREARRKAKGKRKATSSGEEFDYHGERKATRRNSLAYSYSSSHGRDSDDGECPDESPRNTTPEPLASQPMAAEDTDMDMNEYWAGYEMRFGDTDAALNDTLSSPYSPPSSYNYEADNENDPSATSAVRKPLAERRGLTNPGDLVTPQQQQVGSGWGRGRGRGSGTAWGLEWKETVTSDMVREQGWGHPDNPIPSVEGDGQWEVYDEAAWDRAAEKSKELNAGKVTLKLPSAMRAEGSNRRATDSKRVTVRELMRQGWEFVQAVTDYKAILRGTYLSYEKGDVMKVLNRDCDGRLTAHLGSADMGTSLTHDREAVRPSPS